MVMKMNNAEELVLYTEASKIIRTLYKTALWNWTKGFYYKEYNFLDNPHRTWSLILKQNAIKLIIREGMTLLDDGSVNPQEKLEKMKQIETCVKLLKGIGLNSVIYNIKSFKKPIVILHLLDEIQIFYNLDELLNEIEEKLELHDKNKLIYMYSFRKCTIDTIHKVIVGESFYPFSINRSKKDTKQVKLIYPYFHKYVIQSEKRSERI